MPRTVSAELTAAMAGGAFNPYIRGIFYVDGAAHEVEVLKYRLTGLELEAQVAEYYADDYPAHFAIRRGAVIAGNPETLTTGKFYIGERRFEVFNSTDRRISIRAMLFPETRIVLAGDDTYRNVISAFCAAFSKTAVFEDGSAAYWDYRFLPAGKQVILNNAMQFFNLLHQKYFIYGADLGDEEVLFYHAMGDREAEAQYTVWFEDGVDVEAGDLVTHNLLTLEVRPLDQRTYLARDENESIREGGSPGYPLHNLGYLEAADNFPALSTQRMLFSATMGINLKPLDGDIISLDPNTIGTIHYPLQVAEEFNPRAPIAWSTTIEQANVFNNTAGGALPSAIERVSNYTPLNTGNFDGILNRNDNNLQAALDSLDDFANGWIDCLEGWTRAGDFSFTVTGERTVKFRAGTRVRYTQGGAFEYGIVQASSYNAGTDRTTVTLFTNSDHAMASGTVYDKGVSYGSNPAGFPDWFHWTPAFGASGTMTYSAVTVNVAQFKTVGRAVHFALEAEGTTGGTASNTLTATAPCTASLAAAVAAGAMTRDAASGSSAGAAGGVNTSSQIFVRKVDASNYGLGSGRTMLVSGQYPF
ncbi:MAG: hypothetical protein ACM3QS_06220 [Bacteroidota bacterium]